jgi:hypothetical protein
VVHRAATVVHRAATVVHRAATVVHRAATVVHTAVTCRDHGHPPKWVRGWLWSLRDAGDADRVSGDSTKYAPYAP